MVILLSLLTAARADEEDEDVQEIVVYGEVLVQRAKQAVVRDLKAKGYTRIVEKDGKTILRNEAAWKGEVILYDDGWLRMKRQKVQFRPPKNDRPIDYMGCIFVWRCFNAGGQMVGKRKLMGQKTRTLEFVNGEVTDYAEAIADLATDRKVNDLPDRLEALWTSGVPLEGEGTLVTPQERKAAMLAFWESRTTTPWGERMRRAIESFARAEVQSSDTPFTDEEIDAFNLRSTAPYPFTLVKGAETAFGP